MVAAFLWPPELTAASSGEFSRGESTGGLYKADKGTV